jgi:hypothetical protein
MDGERKRAGGTPALLKAFRALTGQLGTRAVVPVEKQNAETRDHQRGINPDVRSEYQRSQHESQAGQKKKTIPRLGSWIPGNIEQRDSRLGRGLLLNVVIDIYHDDGH